MPLPGIALAADAQEKWLADVASVQEFDEWEHADHDKGHSASGGEADSPTIPGHAAPDSTTKPTS